MQESKTIRKRKEAAANAASAVAMASVAPMAPAAAAPLKLVEDIWRAQTRLMEAFANDARVERDEVQEARTPQEVGALGAEVAAAQFGHMAEWVERVGAAMLDAQSAWVRAAEAWTALWLQPVWGHGLATAGSAQDLFEPPAEFTPAAWASKAANAWTQSGAAWMNALQHDLAEAPHRAAA